MLNRKIIVINSRPKTKSKKTEAYHCDGFYFDCPNRGVVDVNDDTNKKRRNKRRFCTSKGIYPDNRLCAHCVETKKDVRPKKHRRLTSKTVVGRNHILYLW